MTYKGVKLRIQEFCDVPENMAADWDIYEEILSHLVINATKFKKEGGEVKIEIFY